MRYFTVESTSPEERRLRGRARGGVKEVAGVAAEGGEFATAFGSCYQRVGDNLRDRQAGRGTGFWALSCLEDAYFFIYVKVINS
jgi:hypothetical protein